jgi:hypothetical protein
VGRRILRFFRSQSRFLPVRARLRAFSCLPPRHAVALQSLLPPAINPTTNQPYVFAKDGLKRLVTSLPPISSARNWTPRPLGSGVSRDRRDSGHICGSTACVISIVEQLKKDDNYHLRVADIENWEAEHGRIPEGSVVFVRSDWSKRWPDPALATTKRFPGVSLAALKFLHEQRKILFSWPRVARYRQHSDAWRNADFPPVPCWIPVKVLSLKSLRDRIEEKLQNGCAKTRHRDCQAGFGLPSIGSAPGDPSRRFVTLVSGVRASSIFSSPSWTTIFVSLSSKTGPVT